MSVRCTHNEVLRYYLFDFDLEPQEGYTIVVLRLIADWAEAGGYDIADIRLHAEDHDAVVLVSETPWSA
jgi:hypothetical protein